MKKSWMGAILFVLACTLGAFQAEPGFQVIIPETPTPQEKYAAEQLQNYLGRVLGTPVAVNQEKTEIAGNALYLGATRCAAEAKMAGFAPGEFRIKAAGNHVIVAGSTERGVLFGAYEFLERFAGVRFFSPECERVPVLKSFNIPDDTDIVHRPVFRSRYVYGGDRKNLTDIFARKMRLTGWASGAELGSSERYGFNGSHCHTFHCYSQDFPEAISWMNSAGVRMQVKSSVSGSICFSQPEVLKRFAKRLKAGIAADRKASAAAGIAPARFYSISQNDCDAACFCPQCRAFAEKHGVSGLVIDFVNRLYDEIKDEYPEVYLVTLAYFDTMLPPQGITPHDHVLVQITSYMQKLHDHLRPIDDPVNVKYLELLENWKKCASGRMAIWDYWRYYNSFLPPVTNVLAVQGMCRKYREIGSQIVFVEYEIRPKQLLSFYDLNFYIGCRVLNDPDCDVKNLIAEFMDTYYGPAAPEMGQYLTLLDEGYRRDPGNGEAMPFHQRRYLRDPEFYRTGLALLKSARAKCAGDAVLLARIDSELLVLESCCLRTWAIHRKKSQLNKQELQEHIEKALPSVLQNYFSPPVIEKNPLPMLNTYYGVRVTFKPAASQLALTPLENFTVPAGAITVPCNEIRGNGTEIKDGDAPGGFARSHSAMERPEKLEKLHQGTFVFGLYESGYQKNLMSGYLEKARVPQDEKYHWYCFGTTMLYPDLSLWMHRNWRLSVGFGPFYRSDLPEQEYKVYLLLKFQGSGYVKNSILPGDVRLAQMVLVPIKSNK